MPKIGKYRHGLFTELNKTLLAFTLDHIASSYTPIKLVFQSIVSKFQWVFEKLVFVERRPGIKIDMHLTHGSTHTRALLHAFSARKKTCHFVRYSVQVVFWATSVQLLFNLSIHNAIGRISRSIIYRIMSTLSIHFWDVWITLCL